MKQKQILVLFVVLTFLPCIIFGEIRVNGILSVDFYDNERDANLDSLGSQVNQGDPMTFDVTALALLFDADITNRIKVQSDILFDAYGEIANGSLNNKIDVLQAYVSIDDIFDWPVNLKIGKFIAPFSVDPYPIGAFNHRPISSSLVKKYTSLGAITGVEASVGWRWFDMQTFIVNGVSPKVNSFTGSDQVNQTSLTNPVGTPTGVDINLNDNDNNLTFGGRLGVTPDFIEGFSGGVSFVQGEVDPDRQYILRNNNSPPAGAGIILPIFDTREQISMWGADAIYTRGRYELRGEFADGRVSNTMATRLPFKGYMGQLAIDVTNRFTLIGRYGWYDQEEHKAPKEDRESWTYGINYLISPQALLKVEYRENHEGPGLGNDLYQEGSTNVNLGLGTVNSSLRVRDAGGENRNDHVGASFIVVF